MSKYTIELEAEVVEVLQKLDFEVKAREFIIKTMLQSKNEINKEIFSQYHEEYVEYFSQFEVAKQMVSDKLIPEFLKGHEISWSVDYVNKRLNMEKLCNCEVFE